MTTIQPVVLFFVFGVLAGVIKSDLKIPEALYKSLSLFLLIAIGFKGGVSMAKYEIMEVLPIAVSVVRSRSHSLGIPEDFYQKNDIHIHLPEGATPKDGPSAGIGICVAMVSVLTNIPVRADVAMTGEITLRGEVLPIGGLKEKLLAAHRGGIKVVIIPEKNVKDLTDIPANVRNQLTIYPVRWIDQVLDLALEHKPELLPVSIAQPSLQPNAEDKLIENVIKH